jgi:electron transfer flavoprotein beta subunit
MKIITCIKQVPASSNVKVDPQTGVLIRDGADTKMNPYDLYAVELALQIKQLSNDSNVKVLTMGPPSAQAVLNEAIWMGADSGILVTDRKFAGADVVATSYTLSQGIRNHEFDLIICGKQTTDGDTAQVGPEVAEYLGIPHIPYVTKIIEVSEDHVVVESHLDKTIEVLEVKLPALLTVEKGTLVPRLPSYKRRRETKDNMIEVLTFKNFQDQDEKNYGLAGSPTQVEQIFPPQKNTDQVKWEGSTSQLTSQLYNTLKEKKFI